MNLRILLSGLAILIVAASCSSGTEGIFASIEREQKIVSLGGLSKYATVTHMAELVTGSSNRYYITGGQALFSRATSAVTWDKTTIGGVITNVSAVGTTGGTPGTTVWVIAGGNLYSSADGKTWTDQTPTGATPFDLIPIRKGDGVSSDELLLTTTNGSLHQFAYLISGSGVGSKVDLGTSFSGPEVTSVVNNGAASYVLLNDSMAWTWDGNPGTATGLPLTISGNSHRFQGLIYRTGTGYYLSTKSKDTTGGGIYFRSDLSGGNFSPLQSDVKSSDAPVSFHQFLYNTTNSSLWIATGASTTTEGNGYAEMDVSGANFSMTPRTNSHNYTSSAIPTFAVGVLFKASDGTYFLGTIAHGLWYWDSADTKNPWKQQ